MKLDLNKGKNNKLDTKRFSTNLPQNLLLLTSRPTKIDTKINNQTKLLKFIINKFLFTVSGEITHKEICLIQKGIKVKFIKGQIILKLFSVNLL